MDEPYEGIFSHLLDEEPAADVAEPLPDIQEAAPAAAAADPYEQPRAAAPEHLQPRAAAPSPAPGPLPPPLTRTAERTAAAGVLMAAGAAAVGAYFGGAWGAGAGALLFGASRNAIRAGRLWGGPEQGEATKAATVSLFGFGVGGVCAYQAYQRGAR